MAWFESNHTTWIQSNRFLFNFVVLVFPHPFHLFADRILLMQMFFIWLIEIALSHRISTNPMQLLCICMVFPNMCQGDQDKVAKKYVTVKAIFITMEMESEKRKKARVYVCVYVWSAFSVQGVIEMWLHPVNLKHGPLFYYSCFSFFCRCFFSPSPLFTICVEWRVRNDICVFYANGLTH